MEWCGQTDPPLEDRVFALSLGTAVGYALIRLEVTDLPREIVIPADSSGIAFDLRREGIPAGFSLHRRPGGTKIEGERLLDLVMAGVAPKTAEPPILTSLPSVTVAICTKDHPELLRRCLASLQGLREIRSDAILEVLVVDNNSIGSETENCARDFRATYCREPITGLNFARNRALASCRTDILAFIDDDAVADPLGTLG
jgi:hypothetical protein